MRRHTLLTPDQHRDIARRAIWYFDCYFGALGADSVVYTGDGVADLDRLIAILEDNRANNKAQNQKFLCDVGTQYAEWRPFAIGMCGPSGNNSSLIMAM
jgi:hypothetical protein